MKPIVKSKISNLFLFFEFTEPETVWFTVRHESQQLGESGRAFIEAQGKILDNLLYVEMSTWCQFLRNSSIFHFEHIHLQNTLKKAAAAKGIHF